MTTTTTSLPKTLLSKQYNTIHNMSQPTIPPPEEPIGGQKVTTATGNVIPTDKEVAKAAEGQAPPPPSSSINPNAAENGQPVYSTDNPLMQPPTPEQLNKSQEQNKLTTKPFEDAERTMATTTISEPRSNPSEEPPINMTATPKPQKLDHTATDATIQGLLVQVIALQHNKIQQIQNNQEQ